VFLQWVRLQASYWLDLAALSRTFGSSDPAQQVPETILLAVKHPESGIEPLLGDSLKTTLNDLISHNCHHPFDINQVQGIIQEKGVDLREYIGPIHCEIMMASLAILADNLPAADTKYAVLANLIRVMFTCIIMMLIDLTRFAEHGPKLHCTIKAMLSNLLGALGHP
jgi:hypothetical protein